MAGDEAFGSMLDQALFAFTWKLGPICGAERASLFVVDEARKELWLRVVQQEGDEPVEFRTPIDAGIAGRVAITGEPLRIADAYAHPLFNPAIDRETGFRTRSVLCLPLRDRDGGVFAVAQLLNRVDGQAFDASDEERFARFTGPLGVVLESWWRMTQGRRAS
jgi:adenylate cyclase